MKIEKMSPYFCESFLKELVRFLTSRYGSDPARAKQGGPGGKFAGRMEALMQSAMRTTSIATTMVHIMSQSQNISLVVTRNLIDFLKMRK